MNKTKCECPARKALGSAIEALEEVFDALGTNRARLDARDFMKAARAALSASCPCEGLREERDMLREALVRKIRDYSAIWAERDQLRAELVGKVRPQG